MPPIAAAGGGGSDVESHHHLTHHHHDPDLCPTCNQTFPAASRTQRQQTLRQELQGHLKTRVQWLRDQRSLQTQHEAGKALIDLERQRNTWQQEIFDLTQQYETLINDQRRYEDEVRTEQALIEALQQAERDEHERFQQVIQTLQSNLTEAEKEASSLDHELRLARQQLQQRQQQYTRWKEQEGQFNVRLGIVEEKLRLTNQTWFQLREQEVQLQQQHARSEEQRRQLVDEATVLSYLSDFFGPKGIQHFVFQSVIDRLEYLANTYLEVLANDGIRLQLRSDVDAEKILKYVLIRQNQEVDGAVDASEGAVPVMVDAPSTGRKKKSTSASTSSSSSLLADGSSSTGVLSSANVSIPLGFRERGLAQLSGGQWRRVSLALDFAFTELVIRRGLLKCNVLVLDEILTHLDGQGREAVGTVLKAMIDRTAQAPSIASDQPAVPVFGGGFETIIVILQDLVANEIEEAFDHIDIVRKDGDVSHVIVDK
jgi:DNA repair exonuclease SbcCD ATPase subunit